MKKYLMATITVISVLILPLVSFAAQTDVDPQGKTSECTRLNNNLRYKTRDSLTSGEVSSLQDFLQSKGYLSGEPTGYFGLLTVNAVKAFQKASDISPSGYVGPVTRNQIAYVSQCGVTSNPTSVTTPVSSNHDVNVIHTGTPIVLTKETDSKIRVAGMNKYTNSDFGYSFWYPESFKIESTEIKNNYSGGKVQKTLKIGSEEVTVSEFISSSMEITVPSEKCSPMTGYTVPSKKYYFDTNKHLWMIETPAHVEISEQYGTSSNIPTSIKAADISKNSMGGLHMFDAGCSSVVMPLSARNFVLFNFSSRNVGPNYINIAKTFLATDPSVATPVSNDEQIKIITKAGILLGSVGTKVGDWYIVGSHVYNWLGEVMANANPSTFKLINKYSDGTPGTPYATDGSYIYAAYNVETPILVGADPTTFVAVRQKYQIPYAKSSGQYGKSFESSESSFAKDKSHVWYSSKLIQGADASTFVVTGNNLVKNSLGSYTIAKDVNNIYGVDDKGNIVVVGKNI